MKENAVKTEDTSAKKTESRKISDDDVEQVSGGSDIRRDAQNDRATLFGVPGSGDIKPLPD